MQARYHVIDSDGHLFEDTSAVAKRLPHPYSDPKWAGSYPIFPTLDGRFRRAQTGITTAEQWLEFLDATGIDVGVIYPTLALSLGLVQNRADETMAQYLSRAYNDWVAETYAAKSARLRPVAILAPQEPELAAQELERAVRELKLCGAMLPSVTTPLSHFGDPRYEVLWETAERLNCPLAIHGAPQAGLPLDIFRRHIEAHVLEHPLPLFMHVTGMVFEGVFERHPNLDVAFLEAGAGWLPYLMDRMDYEYETRPHDAPAIRKKPSEYLRSGHIYVTCEPEEASVAYVVERFPASCLLYASDFPHERSLELYRHDLEELQEREDLPAGVVRQMLWDNPRRFYRFQDL